MLFSPGFERLPDEQAGLMPEGTYSDVLIEQPEESLKRENTS
jgi:hypothetical protein